MPPGDGFPDFTSAIASSPILKWNRILKLSNIEYTLSGSKTFPVETYFDLIIVDGNKFRNYNNIPHKAIVKGDAKYLSIAAASVLAKTYRDEYMAKIHLEFPMYNWSKNKGYPTKEHRNGIREFGVTKYHRKTFKLLPEQTKLDL